MLRLERSARVCVRPLSSSRRNISDDLGKVASVRPSMCASKQTRARERGDAHLALLLLLSVCPRVVVANHRGSSWLLWAPPERDRCLVSRQQQRLRDARLEKARGLAATTRATPRRSGGRASNGKGSSIVLTQCSRWTFTGRRGGWRRPTISYHNIFVSWARSLQRVPPKRLSLSHGCMQSVAGLSLQKECHVIPRSSSIAEYVGDATRRCIICDC